MVQGISDGIGGDGGVAHAGTIRSRYFVSSGIFRRRQCLLFHVRSRLDRNPSQVGPASGAFQRAHKSISIPLPFGFLRGFLLSARTSCKTRFAPGASLGTVMNQPLGFRFHCPPLRNEVLQVRQGFRQGKSSSLIRKIFAKKFLR